MILFQVLVGVANGHGETLQKIATTKFKTIY
jgi:hypothetical protein